MGAGEVGSRAGVSRGGAQLEVVLLPRVDAARFTGVAPGRVQSVAESAVGADVEAFEQEGFVRIATCARHAILLRLFRRRLPTLACLAGVSSALAGPLLENITCSTPSLNSSTYRAHVPFAQHCRYSSRACWEVEDGLLLLGV